MFETAARLSRPLTVRIGLPTPGGRLVAAARCRHYPVLFSANAFAQRYPCGHPFAGSFRRFRPPDARQLEGLDAALDSAGFVAATRYREYPWSVEEYVELVASYPWRWWASMDYCCEPEVAHDRPLRLLRMAATVVLYDECRRTARERGLSDPMPVLQGWTAQEYLQSVHWLALDEWPALVGVGSVCGRAVRGCNGVLEIVEALDHALPPGVRLHLFGVKSEALTALANHPRVASTDSMAWDAQARRERPVGRDARFRIRCMERWAEKQCAQLTIHARGGGVQTMLPTLFDEPIRSDLEARVLEGARPAICRPHVFARHLLPRCRVVREAPRCDGHRPRSPRPRVRLGPPGVGRSLRRPCGSCRTTAPENGMRLRTIKTDSS